MNEIVANYLLTKFDGLDWMEKKAGLVRPITFETPNAKGSGTIRKIFPIWAEPASTCDTDKISYMDLVPDSSKKAIAYFEEVAFEPNGLKGNFYHFKSTLRLVVWLNGKLIGGDEQTLASEKIQEVFTALKPVHGALPNYGIMKGILLHQSHKVEMQNPAIFSRYSYDEAKNQYLMYPYSYFAIQISVTFRMPKDC